jgi:glyoxylase-like metal-dependent hydrolase (beta-lactamase superfamily II)
MHSALIVSGRRGRVLIDCGEDWLGRVRRLHPAAILISHAHDDHAGGLRKGAPCAVYASAEAWNAMAAWPLAVRYVVPARHPFAIACSSRRQGRRLHALWLEGGSLGTE